MKIDICICTYDRTELLRDLISDLLNQETQISQLIIVDGNPKNNTVLEMLHSLKYRNIGRIIYCPSNHPNIAYQRYLGWKLSKGCEYLIYFDDDLRIYNQLFISNILRPFTWTQEGVVCVTAVTKQDNKAKNNKKNRFLNICPRRFAPKSGSISVLGDRVFPKEMSGYQIVDWVQGRVMAYRQKYLSSDCFPEDIFTLFERRLGMGEDTIISRYVKSMGDFYCAFDVEVYHMGFENPKAYSTDPYNWGRTVAISRMAMIHHFRGHEGPKFLDYLILFKRFIAGFFLSWLRVVVSRFSVYEVLYAKGYTRGIRESLYYRQTINNLNKDINWQKDAEEALTSQVVLS